MALPVLILRPEPGASATLAAARAMGLDAQVFPLFHVRPLNWQPVAADDVDAVLLGSANSLRHGGPALADLRGLPAYAVGETTANAALQAGLDVVATGKGGLQNLLGVLAPTHRRLLRLAGRERVDLTLPPGVTMETREVYASEPRPADNWLTGLLSQPVVVLLHSGEAAARLVEVCAAVGIDGRHIHLAAIGPRVAERAGGSSSSWAQVCCAETPNDAALLALAARMCQEHRPGH